MPEHGAGCVYISVKNAGSSVLHMVAAIEKQLQAAEIIRTKLASVAG